MQVEVRACPPSWKVADISTHFVQPDLFIVDERIVDVVTAEPAKDHVRAALPLLLLVSGAAAMVS